MGVKSRQGAIARLVVAIGILLSMLLAGGAPSDFAHRGGTDPTPTAKKP